MVKSFEQLLYEVSNRPSKKVAVVSADDLDTLSVVAEAESKKLAEFILIGDEGKIKEILDKEGLKIQASIVHEPDHRQAAEKAALMVRNGEAYTMMKGMLHSSVFLKAILNKEQGLNTGRHITQISVLEKDEGGLLMVTDCAISVAPDLKGKAEIIANAVDLAHNLGIELPKVAVITALEVVNPEMQDTLDAAVLSKMAQRGQIKGCIVDGPLALDNAISKDAAKAKGIDSEVAGQADIILVPNLTVGNVLTKSISYIAKKPVIAATVGAKVPVIFTSRTESREGKLLTIALAVYSSGKD